MQQNPFTFLGQAISQLLSSNSATLEATGLDMFRGLAVILIVWFGIKAALSASQGHGGFHFAKFADLILMIAFGLGMLTYYSTPIPGVGYSFSDLITQEALHLSGQIESDQTQQIADAVVNAEEKLGSPTGIFSFHEELTFMVISVSLAAMQAVAFAVIAYGLVASAVCVLVGPIFIPFFIVPKLDFLFWGQWNTYRHRGWRAFAPALASSTGSYRESTAWWWLCLARVRMLRPGSGSWPESGHLALRDCLRDNFVLGLRHRDTLAVPGQASRYRVRSSMRQYCHTCWARIGWTTA